MFHHDMYLIAFQWRINGRLTGWMTPEHEVATCAEDVNEILGEYGDDSTEAVRITYMNLDSGMVYDITEDACADFAATFDDMSDDTFPRWLEDYAPDHPITLRRAAARDADDRAAYAMEAAE
ncbi:MAG: hypothetical protein EP341_09670 [Sphingomonadales bacterium]|nr:MAG: hypothetical protein EP341_09670 [Sphingomonadales bacterium]